MTAVLSKREASIFACLTDTLLAPAPPLPPVAETDAVAAFDVWLQRAPRANRIVLRALLLGLGLARGRRAEVLRRLEHGRGRPVVEALRATAAISYYGDARVCALLGYVPARERER